MKAYFDSAVIVKLYVPEPNSREAAAFVSGSSRAVAFSQLHENEVRNAIRLKLARREVTHAQVETAIRRIHEDLSEGRLSRPVVDWTRVWAQAEDLSASHASHVSCRTLDTLHVALAIFLGTVEFVSFDVRQRQLAARAGLRLLPGASA